MKRILTHFFLPTFALFGVISGISIAQSSKQRAEIMTLETMIVASGTVAMDLDLNRLLDGANARETSKLESVRFEATSDSYFPVIVYNNQLRGTNQGSIGLIAGNAPRLPAALNDSFRQLVIERVSFDQPYELVVRDAKTGFVYFNIEGHSYEFDAAARTLQMTNGRVLVSDGFAKNMGRPADSGAVVGNISMATKLRVIESKKALNGEVESVTLPGIDSPTAVVGPDVIVGDLPAVQQVGSATGGRVGVVVATTSCNKGDVQLNWFAMSNTDHPVIPQNLYRMSGGADNTQRFEQVGQSWLKHAFTALQQNACGFGCQSSGTGTRLGVGCSDPYGISENQTQTGLGSRAWVNPFTGVFPSTANSHSGHSHDGTAHRTLVDVNDLNTNLNGGAKYFAEGQYVTPHEFAYCQANPSPCNVYNNVSYRRFTVTGTANFSFQTVVGEGTVREKAALEAWTGATINKIEPVPGTDGQGFVGYKVSGPVDGVYHYEYAVYNQNLDRGIQSFSVPLGCGVTISNAGFHAPPNHPSFTNDNIGGTGLSNAVWPPTQTAEAVTWNSETFAQNPNANAIRWGTLYNYRFDSTRPPAAAIATVGFFKTGAPMTVAIQAPSAEPCAPLQLTSAVSRKMHGALGPFDIDLPLAGSPGIECRRSSGGSSGDHTLVVTFTNNVVSGNAAVTAGTGAVSGSPIFAGNTMTVNVTGVPETAQMTVMLSGVTDNFAQTYPDTGVVMKALFGDVGGNSSVTASDIGEVKSVVGQTVGPANFRDDVTADGDLSASDISAVKSRSGSAL